VRSELTHHEHAERPADRDDKPPIGRPPLDRSDLAALLATYCALVAVFTAIGLVVKRWDRLDAWDQSESRQLAESRTPRLNTLSWWGSNLSETLVKIVVTAIVAGVMLYVWRRWREALMIIVPLVLEAAVFITVTWIVKRPRPPVEQLDGSPVSSSFPSGHVAAAVCYSAIAIVVFWHTRRTWARALAVLLSIAVPLIVGWARAYRGMHYISDVVAGVVLGLVTVVISWWLLERRSVAVDAADVADALDARAGSTSASA
jgi:membrane-associated phospholipid phosphatase